MRATACPCRRLDALRDAARAGAECATPRPPAAKPQRAGRTAPRGGTAAAPPTTTTSCPDKELARERRGASASSGMPAARAYAMAPPWLPLVPSGGSGPWCGEPSGSFACSTAGYRRALPPADLALTWSWARSGRAPVASVSPLSDPSTGPPATASVVPARPRRPAGPGRDRRQPGRGDGPASPR